MMRQVLPVVPWSIARMWRIGDGVVSVEWYRSVGGSLPPLSLQGSFGPLSPLRKMSVQESYERALLRGVRCTIGRSGTRGARRDGITFVLVARKDYGVNVRRPADGGSVPELRRHEAKCRVYALPRLCSGRCRTYIREHRRRPQRSAPGSEVLGGVRHTKRMTEELVHLPRCEVVPTLLILVAEEPCARSREALTFDPARQVPVHHCLTLTFALLALVGEGDGVALDAHVALAQRGDPECPVLLHV